MILKLPGDADRVGQWSMDFLLLLFFSLIYHMEYELASNLIPKILQESSLEYILKLYYNAIDDGIVLFSLLTCIYAPYPGAGERKRRANELGVLLPGGWFRNCIGAAQCHITRVEPNPVLGRGASMFLARLCVTLLVLMLGKRSIEKRNEESPEDQYCPICGSRMNRGVCPNGRDKDHMGG